MSVKNNHPIAIFLRGLPGSGKSYVVKTLADKLGRDKVVLLDPDATDYQSPEYLAHAETMRAEGVEDKLHAYRFLRGKAYKAIEDNKIIIWDQPFRNLEIFHKMIDRFEEHASAHNTKVSVLVVEVEVDPAVAKGRIAERKRQGGHGPSDEMFDQFIAEHKSFEGEGFKIVKIDGQDDPSTSVDTIVAALESLLS